MLLYVVDQLTIHCTGTSSNEIVNLQVSTWARPFQALSNIQFFQGNFPDTFVQLGDEPVTEVT